MNPRSTWSLLRVVAALSLAAPLVGCSAAAEPDVDEEGVDGPEPTGNRGDPVNNGTVADAVSQSCTTSSVLGLSQQIIAEGNCISPGTYDAVPDLANISFNSNVFPYLEAPARDALVAALNAAPSKSMTVVSMLRTVAQQYMLYRWYVNGKCGIKLAAKPGASNHETGLALDISEWSSWKTTLQSKGFKWLGSSDAPHFDYAGAGAVSHKGVDVKAFQRLWNANHPEDKITEDGIWGSQSEARMKKSPAAGFAIGSTCAAPPPVDDPVDDPVATCAHSACEAGPVLKADCDPCVTKICAADPYCCATEWDSVCTGQVATVCSASCDAQPGGDCGAYAGLSSYTCAGDGSGRGKCASDTLDYESCANGCLIQTNDDVCMGTTSTWSCTGTWGTAKAQNGDYYGTSFGCWKDANGVAQSDPGDNCIPACLSQAQSSGLCAGMSGPECERNVSWFAADAGRFGCMARLKVTNPKNGKSVVVVALDYGPNCSVEKTVSHAAIDLSYPASNYLFGDQVGIVEKALTHVVEVDPSTPLGPI